MSTCMYYTGLDPRTMKPVYVPKSPHEKAMQRALIQYRNPKNYDLVVEALRKAGREELIGFGKNCLVRPRKLASEKQGNKNEGQSKKQSQRNDKQRNIKAAVSKKNDKAKSNTKSNKTIEANKRKSKKSGSR